MPSVSFEADIKPIRDALAGMEGVSKRAAATLIGDLRRSYAEHVAGVRAATKAREVETAAALSDLARVADEAEKVRIGPEQFGLRKALADLDALEARLRSISALDATAAASIATRRIQLQGDLARVGSTTGEMQGPALPGAPPPTAAMVEYDRALASLRTHTESAARSQASLAGGMQAVAMQAPDVVAQLAAGAPVMQVLTQQGLQVGQSMLATAGSLSSLGAALAPLAPLLAAGAVAAAALAAAYSLWANAADEAADAGGRVRASVEAADAAVVKARAGVADLRDEWAAYSRSARAAAEDVQVQIGGLSGVRLEAERAEAAARKAADAPVKAQADLVAQLGRRITAEEALRRSGALTMAADIESSRILGEMRDAHRAATATLGDMRAEQDRAGLAAYSLAEAQAEEAETARNASRAQEGRRKALDDTRAALDRLAEADRLYAQQQADRADGVAELRGIIADAAAFEQSEIGRIIEQRDLQIARVEELAALTGRLDLAQQAAAAIRAEAETALDVELQAIEAERERRAEESTQRALARAEQVRAATMRGSSEMFGNMAEAAQTAADLAADSSEAGARRAFAAYKAFAIAQATIDAVAAGARALRDYPFPLSLAVAASAYGAGVARVATIAATEPKFHTGLAPDETRATLTRGEGVLTQRGVQALGGPQGVREANAGRQPAQQQAAAPIAVLVPPGAPGRLLRDALATREGRDLARRATGGRLEVRW